MEWEDALHMVDATERNRRTFETTMANLEAEPLFGDGDLDTLTDEEIARYLRD